MRAVQSATKFKEKFLPLHRVPSFFIEAGFLSFGLSAHDPALEKVPLFDPHAFMGQKDFVVKEGDLGGGPLLAICRCVCGDIVPIRPHP